MEEQYRTTCIWSKPRFLYRLKLRLTIATLCPLSNVESHIIIYFNCHFHTQYNYPWSQPSAYNCLMKSPIKRLSTSKTMPEVTRENRVYDWRPRGSTTIWSPKSPGIRVDLNQIFPWDPFCEIMGGCCGDASGWAKVGFLLLLCATGLQVGGFLTNNWMTYNTVQDTYDLRVGLWWFSNCSGGAACHSESTPSQYLSCKYTPSPVAAPAVYRRDNAVSGIT